jgi:hypothetical protein
MKQQIGLGSSLATFWWHSDIVALQSSIKSALDATNTDVNACAGVDAGSKQAWAAFYTSATAYTQESAAWIDTGSQADHLQDLQRQLLAWQQFLTGKGCALGSPMVQIGPAETGKTLENIAKYGAIIAVAWGSAYLVSQVVAFIPHPVGAGER